MRGRRKGSKRRGGVSFTFYFIPVTPKHAIASMGLLKMVPKQKNWITGTKRLRDSDRARVSIRSLSQFRDKDGGKEGEGEGEGDGEGEGEGRDGGEGEGEVEGEEDESQEMRVLTERVKSHFFASPPLLPTTPSPSLSPPPSPSSTHFISSQDSDPLIKPLRRFRAQNDSSSPPPPPPSSLSLSSTPSPSPLSLSSTPSPSPLSPSPAVSPSPSFSASISANESNRARGNFLGRRGK